MKAAVDVDAMQDSGSSSGSEESSSSSGADSGGGGAAGRGAQAQEASSSEEGAQQQQRQQPRPSKQGAGAKQAGPHLVSACLGVCLAVWASHWGLLQPLGARVMVCPGTIWPLLALPALQP